jgi:hypothetical protein
MAKDKKAKQAQKKARVAEKTNKKAAQKEKKGKTKGRRPGDDSDVDDIDLDAVLEEYARQVSLAFCPSTRWVCSSSFIHDHLAASPVPQSHRGPFRPTISSVVLYPSWVAVKQQRTVPLWGRAL